MTRIRLTIFAFVIVSFTTCCQHSSKRSSLPPSEDKPSTGAAATPVVATLPPLKIQSGDPKEDSLVAKPLTAVGYSTQARFSKDGSRLLFVSGSRPMHRQAQIYELHLELMKEKRVTFHDGDDSSPVYSPDDKYFLFASETDEIKEEPLVSQRLIKTYYPEGLRQNANEATGEGPAIYSEIYRQTLHGRSIERLTKAQGFDGDIDIDPKGKRIVFSASRARGATRLHIQQGHVTRAITSGVVIDRGARFSPNGRALVWSRGTPDAKEPTVQLMIAEGDFTKAQPLASVDRGKNLHPAWHPSGELIVFSSNREGERYNLYVTDRAGTCIRRLTTAEFDQWHPTFRPDGKQLIFTSEYEGRPQIYLMDFRPPADCPPPKASAPPPAKAAKPPAKQ